MKVLATSAKNKAVLQPFFHQKLAYSAHRIATTATLAILNDALVA